MNTIDRQNRLAQNSARLSVVINEMGKLVAQINPLSIRLNSFSAERSSLESLVFIDANKITKADVEFSSGSDRPYFGRVDAFIKYLKEPQRSPKPWAEWNGQIYNTADLLNNRMPDVPGRTSDLQD